MICLADSIKRLHDLAGFVRVRVRDLRDGDAGMDHDSHEKLVEGLLSLHKDHGIAVLFISHHLHDLESADQILLVKDGSVTPYQGGDHHVEL